MGCNLSLRLASFLSTYLRKKHLRKQVLFFQLNPLMAEEILLAWEEIALR